MQKLARSTFSATAKDSLLDEFKAIVDAGEVTLRSDSSTIAQLERTYHLDSHEIARYTRAIESLNDRYGWHLDAQKTLSRLGKKLGKKCGGGWISPEKRCKSHYTDGKLNSSGKTSSADLADRIRSRKKMAAIRSRDGKMKNGQWDIGAAFAPGNEQQSSIRASRTGPNNNRTLNPDRAARMMAKEENRARVNWGRTTGDWKQQPDSTAARDMVKPMAERRIARQEADRIMEESGATQAIGRAIGKVAMIDPARTPVRIPNQRRSNEPRKRGRSVD